MQPYYSPTEFKIVSKVNTRYCVLWMPEYLGKEGNKLLKLIEEPPPNTVFILVAENEELILPTHFKSLPTHKSAASLPNGRC